MPVFYIDDQEVEFEQGQDILTVALKNGLDIPHFCYHEGLSRAATCRMCLVDILDAGNGRPIPKLQTSCSTPIAENMKVSFDNPKVKDAQSAVMEFLLINHPLDCPICDQAGECLLQEYSYNFGSGKSEIEQEKRVYGIRKIGSFLNLERNRCIHCTRCVRFSQEISGTHEMGAFGRSHNLTVDTFIDQPLSDNFQGNLADICPVGAITVSDFRFRQKVWKLNKTESICTHCSRGCNIHIHHKNNKVYRFTPRENQDVNQWWMCDQGRVSFHEILEKKKRLKRAKMMGQDCDSKQAFLKISQLIHQLKETDKVFVLASKYSSLEEIIALQKFCENIDAKVTIVSPSASNEDIISNNAIENLVKSDKSPNANGLKQLNIETIDLQSYFNTFKENEFALAIIINNLDEELCFIDKKNIFSEIIYLSPFENQFTEIASVSFATKNNIEKDGFFINCDGYIQQTKQAIHLQSKDVFDEFMIYSILLKQYLNKHHFASSRNEFLELLEMKLNTQLQQEELFV